MQHERKLKNAQARLTTRPMDTIQEQLSTIANSVQFFYKDGQAIAIAFSLIINSHEVNFRLPARIRNVQIYLYGKKDLTERQKKQAYITAWANIRDWISAQIALIQTGMVKPEEVFLPYMLNEDRLTLFEAMEKRQFLLDQPN